VVVCAKQAVAAHISMAPASNTLLRSLRIVLLALFSLDDLHRAKVFALDRQSPSLIGPHRDG